MDSHSLRGKVVLVTGAAKSLGYAMSNYFEDNGATVIRTDIDDADSSVQRLDVRRRNDWETVVDQVVHKFGQLDGLVNNAAVIFRMGPFWDETDEEFAELLRTNIMGGWLGTQVVSRTMASTGGGSIVNLSSTSGVIGAGLFCGYGTTRWAVRGMTKHVAADLASQRIRLNSIHPHGILNTGMSDKFAPDDMAERARNAVEGSPLHRGGTVDDVSSVAAYLLSDESSWITGREFVIDGGATVTP